MSRSLPTLVVVACASLLGAASFTSKKIAAEGFANIEQGDLAKARAEAIKNAQRNAIEQVVGAYVQSEFSADERALANDKGSSFSLSVRDKIVTRSEGFIERQRVLGEKRDGDLYRVQLEVEVRTASLADELKSMGSLLQKVGYPKITVLAAERYTPKSGTATLIASPTLQPVLEEALMRYGIDVVGKQKASALQANAAGLFAELEAMEQGRAPQGRTEELEREGAEVLITARAEDKFTGFNEFNDNNYYVSSQVVLRAIDTASGSVLASAEKNGKGIGANEDQARIKAVKAVSGELTEKLIQQLVQAWQQRVERGQTFHLVFAKVTNYAKIARRLIAALEACGKFELVKEASFDDAVLEVEVRFKGDEKALLGVLFDELAQQPAWRKLSRKRVEGSRIFLSL